MKKAKVLILAGQSNAVGVGYTKYMREHFDDATVKDFINGYENVLINYFSHYIYSNGFVKTRINCTERDKDTLGPEVGIAKYLNEHFPDQKFFLIKCAIGGTNLYHDWLSPSTDGYLLNTHKGQSVADLNNDRKDNGGWCYNELIKIVNESLSILQAQGYTPQITNFFWMQGESDSDFIETAENYIKRFDAFYNDFKVEFSSYLEKCVLVDAGISSRWKFFKEINSQKKDYAKNKGHIYLDTIKEGLTTTNEPKEQPDTAHYDCDSTIKLGELFASFV